MPTDASEPTLHIDREQLLLERLRLVAWVSLIATPIYFTVEAVSRPVNLGARVLLVVVQFSVLVGLLAVIRQPWLRRHVLAASVVLTIDMAAGTVVSGLLRQDVEVTAANLLLLVFGCSILFPWGAAAQALLGLVAVLGLGVNLWATPSASPTVPVIATLGCALSVLVAYVLERGRAALAGEILERRAAEAQLRCARDQLEQRVAERTESLGRANESLAAANARLEAEVEERKKIQLDLERAREAAEAGIRDIEGASGRHTPIIAVTAGALGSDRDRFLEVGMDDYVSKPVSFGQLRALLGRWAVPADPAAGQGPCG